MNNFLRPSLYNSDHEILPVKDSKQKNMKLLVQFVRVVMFSKKTSISELKQDDLVIILSTGAYGYIKASVII